MYINGQKGDTLTTGSIAVGFGSIVTDDIITTSVALTGGSIHVGADQIISPALQLQNIASLDATTTSTIQSVIGTLTSVGALDTGSIVSGFGTISTDNPITTSVALTGGSMWIDGVSVFNNSRQLINVTAIDSSTETVIETAIDTLPNFLNSVIQKTDALKTFKLNTTSVSSSTYTVLDDDTVIHCDSSSNDITINLPAAVSHAGRVLYIKDASGSASSNNVTIDANSTELIDGSLTLVINVNYNSATLQCNGTKWLIL